MSKKAIKLVIEYERRQGRNPKDVSNRYLGFDIKSDDRLIEVKQRDIRRGFVFLTENEFLTFMRNKNAYLYVVYDIDKEPKLKIIDRDTVLANAKILMKIRVNLGKKILEKFDEIKLR